MRVLGIDTSGYANAIGVIDDERILADFSFEAKTDSLEKIVINIDSALQSAGLTLEEVQGIGVGLGPGSWTGIRVGVTVGKMLAFSTGKPVCGVPTLEALAYSARNESSLICPIIGAGTKDMVYAAFYLNEDGNIGRAGEYYVGDLKGLSKKITETTVLVGHGASSYRRIISQEIGSSRINIRPVEAVPSGALVALLAANRLERGESDDVLSLTPLYLKESTARALMGRNSRGTQVNR
jgi:tRNA threonylcarbamoyladenosine biosynthesis protein TsaB